MKLLIKLAIAALIINAAWQTGMGFAGHYEFQDAIREAALKSEQTDDQLRQRVLELAAEHEVPLGDEDFTIERVMRHTYVRGAYQKNVSILPGYDYPWRFNLDVDAYIIEPPKLP